jgi:methionine-rich copper-binding protein CopC
MTKALSFLVGLLLICLSFIGGAMPASAHAELANTSPADGAILESAPESLTLNFNSRVLDGMAEVAVTNSSGFLVTGVIAKSAQTTVSAPWPADLPGDTYVIAYRIVSEDGHPITGSFSFSYPDSQTAAVQSEVTPIETPSAAATTAEPTTAEPTTAEPTASEPASSESGSESGSIFIWVLGFLALAMIVAGYFIWRKRST